MVAANAISIAITVFRKTRGMTEIHSMYHAQSRSDLFKGQIEKLEGLAHHTVVNPSFEPFDNETEEMLNDIYGADHPYVESYKYATIGEMPKHLSIYQNPLRNL